MNQWRAATFLILIAMTSASICRAELMKKDDEMRGLWVTRWNYKTADDVRRIVGEAHGAGFNTLFWQVRGQADALYRSSIEPWSAELTGVLGKDPGFDPLRLVLDEAHARGMQVHAWMNVFPIWKGIEAPPHSEPEHIFYAHPEWRAVNDKGEPIGLNEHYVFASPGIPALREHVARVVFDLAKRYDVDGVHLDYVRYGGKQYSHDAVSRDVFAKSGKSWEDFQREQVNATVREIFSALKQVRPMAELSAAVWGVYRNEWKWEGVSQGYVDFYQDPRAWIEGDYVDFVCPMIYWPITKKAGAKLDFSTLAANHVAGCGSARVVLGLQTDYESFDEIAAEIAAARKLGVRGVALFAYASLMERDALPKLVAGPFRAR